MTADRMAKIDAAIQAYEAADVSWTNKMIHERIGGNYGELATYLKARRAKLDTAVPAAIAPVPSGGMEVQGYATHATLTMAIPAHEARPGAAAAVVEAGDPVETARATLARVQAEEAAFAERKTVLRGELKALRAQIQAQEEQQRRAMSHAIRKTLGSQLALLRDELEEREDAYAELHRAHQPISDAFIAAQDALRQVQEQSRLAARAARWRAVEKGGV